MADVKRIQIEGPAKKQHAPASSSPPIPRITRLMALAIWFDELIRTDEVKDYAELARIGKVSRPRVTQIMDLLNLSPTIQQGLLAGPSAAGTPTERSLRESATRRLWSAQATTPIGL